MGLGMVRLNTNKGGLESLGIRKAIWVSHRRIQTADQLPGRDPLAHASPTLRFAVGGCCGTFLRFTRCFCKLPPTVLCVCGVEGGRFAMPSCPFELSTVSIWPSNSSKHMTRPGTLDVGVLRALHPLPCKTLLFGWRFDIFRCRPLVVGPQEPRAGSVCAQKEFQVQSHF